MTVLSEADQVVRMLTLERLPDPLVEERGHHVTSRYCEEFWLPTIGPSALWMLRHVSRHSETGPYVVDAEVLGSSLGLGGGLGRQQPLRKTLDRLVRFECALGWHDTYQLRTHLPDLSVRQLRRLPEPLLAAHAKFGGER